MRDKKREILAGFLGLTLLLSACGKNAEPAEIPEPPQETEPASEAPTEVPAQEPEAPQE